jgi:ABC-type Fe3+/spermidine/putrescine transport system ATPase subunit
MIKIEGLDILLGTFRIMGLHIEIHETEFHSLLGPTGCGKTLILESIMGLRKPIKGKIRIGEREVQGLPPERREISYVPQDLALFPHLSVRDNIFYGIKARHLEPKGYEEHIHVLVQQMKVAPLLERFPANLSGGEKKRVALLRALAVRPKLLLLDEPLAGLDPSIKAEIQQVLKTLHTTLRPTVLCVTHDFEEAHFLSDRITVFMDGTVEQSGNRDDIFLRPASKKVACFLGANNVYRGKVLKRDERGRRVTLSVNNLHLSLPITHWRNTADTKEEVDLFVRPEEVMIIREGKPVKESLKHNIFEGTVIDVIDQRRYRVVHFQTLHGKILFEILIPNYAFRNLDIGIGKPAHIALRDESFWMMS